MILTIVEQRSMSADPKHKKHSHCQSNFSAVEKLKNLALNKPAFQKDDGVWGGLASRAVDGNSAAEWVKSSCNLHRLIKRSNICYLIVYISFVTIYSSIN